MHTAILGKAWLCIYAQLSSRGPGQEPAHSVLGWLCLSAAFFSLGPAHMCRNASICRVAPFCALQCTKDDGKQQHIRSRLLLVFASSAALLTALPGLPGGSACLQPVAGSIVARACMCKYAYVVVVLLLHTHLDWGGGSLLPEGLKVVPAAIAAVCLASGRCSTHVRRSASLRLLRAAASTRWCALPPQLCRRLDQCVMQCMLPFLWCVCVACGCMRRSNCSCSAPRVFLQRPICLPFFDPRLCTVRGQHCARVVLVCAFRYWSAPFCASLESRRAGQEALGFAMHGQCCKLLTEVTYCQHYGGAKCRGTRQAAFVTACQGACTCVILLAGAPAWLGFGLWRVWVCAIITSRHCVSVPATISAAPQTPAPTCVRGLSCIGPCTCGACLRLLRLLFVPSLIGPGRTTACKHAAGGSCG